MDFEDRINELIRQIDKRAEHVSTEEATKNALVMPFIAALGYDVFNPTEVVPEFTADVGTKKGEKVDYAVFLEEKPVFLFECKTLGTKLANVHMSQLYRYFTVTDVRFAILTNGVVYQFYSDLEEPNRMDEKPFLIVDLLNMRDDHYDELKRFRKGHFDEDEIVSTAGELKYTREIKRVIGNQLTDPDEEFVKFFASQVYSGRMTQAVKEQFTDIVRKALKQFINDRLSQRLQIAAHVPDIDMIVEDAEIEENQEETPKIVTTQMELDGYFVVKSILREVVSVNQVTMRDTKSYCGILFDDNNRKPICRLHFNRTQKYIELFDEDKNSERIAIESVDDIYQYAERLKTVTLSYVDD